MHQASSSGVKTVKMWRVRKIGDENSLRTIRRNLLENAKDLIKEIVTVIFDILIRSRGSFVEQKPDALQNSPRGRHSSHDARHLSALHTAYDTSR